MQLKSTANVDRASEVKDLNLDNVTHEEGIGCPVGAQSDTFQPKI